MLIKPKGPRACKGLSKTSLHDVLGWQKLGAFQLWNENASDVAVVLTGCSKEQVIRCPPAFAAPFGLRHAWAVVGGEGSRAPCL